MNYWHKANQWARSGTPQAILKDREAHYCQVTVDRVSGNQETGRIDEEAHVAFVRDSLQRTGLGYYDDMQFHFGYHNAAEVLTAVIADGLFEHAQFMYSYGADPAMDGFLELARKKGFGTTAIKTARGIGRMREDQAFIDSLPEDTAPHNALTRWLTTATKLDAAVIRVRNLDEFAETYSGAGRSLRAGDVRAIEIMAARADRTACRLCTECQPHCPQHISIAEILRFERYAVDDGDIGKARTLYAGLDRRADACAACGSCLAHCPQGLPIPDRLAAAHALLHRA